jgi:hypothetical protein
MRLGKQSPQHWQGRALCGERGHVEANGTNRGKNATGLGCPRNGRIPATLARWARWAAMAGSGWGSRVAWKEILSEWLWTAVDLSIWTMYLPDGSYIPLCIWTVYYLGSI